MVNITGLNYQPQEQFTKILGSGHLLESDRVIIPVTTDIYRNFENGVKHENSFAPIKHSDKSSYPKDISKLPVTTIGSPTVTIHRSVGVIMDSPAIVSKWQEFSKSEIRVEEGGLAKANGKPRTFYKPFEYVSTVVMRDGVFIVNLYVSGYKVQNVKGKNGDFTEQVYRKHIVKNSYTFTYSNVVNIGFLNIVGY